VALQISRAFKDVSLSFVRNPITNDILAIRNEDAIKKSVTNLVRTQIGERFFNDLIGTSINKNIFELFDEEISESLGEEITTLLENFEPRVLVKNVNILSDQDSYTLNVTIAYDIIGLPFPTQNVEFLLQPTRN
jgi:phage baseplate assembly protein W